MSKVNRGQSPEGKVSEKGAGADRAVSTAPLKAGDVGFAQAHAKVGVQKIAKALPAREASDEDRSLLLQADDAKGEGEQSADAPLALADSLMSSSLLVDSALLASLAQAGAAAAADDGDDDGEGSDLTLPLLGGLVLIAGGAALASTGGGNDDSSGPPPPPANQAPSITSGTTATVAENISTTTTVYDANATDPEGSTLTYTIGGTDAAAFDINASTGVVTFKASPDFETKASYTITVTASDGTLSDTETVTIAVTNVNEAPVAKDDAALSVDENVAFSYDASAADVDADAALTYALSGADAAAFSVSSAGVLTLNAPADFEAKSSYTVVVTASDGSLSDSQTITLSVNDVNEEPVSPADAVLSIDENVAFSYDASAEDPDGDALTYALSGADAAAFSIDANGVLTLNAPANFEAKNSYTVVVTASDGVLTDSQTVTLNVNDVNEAPVITSGATGTVDENEPTSAVVYDASATDPDAGDVLTYSLSGADAAAFNIDSATGEVRLNASANYEAVQSYSFTVTATDAGGLSASQAVAINVNDLVDNASVDVGSQSSIVTLDAGIQSGDVFDTNFRFTETSPAESTVEIVNFGANDFIFFQNFDPDDYSFINEDYDGDGDAGDLVISRLDESFAVNLIVLLDALDPLATVFDEATAEAALAANLGAGDYLQGSAVPTDVDTDSFVTFNAGGVSATFLEDGDTESSIVINNFRSDDRIVFSNLNIADLSFTTDTDPSDLRIEYFDSGDTNFVSVIILNDVLDPLGPPIFDELSAEAALGGGDFFQFA